MGRAKQGAKPEASRALQAVENPDMAIVNARDGDDGRTGEIWSSRGTC